MALGSRPLGLISDLPKGPDGARGVHIAQDLARSLHCDVYIGNLGKSLCKFQGER